LRRAFYRRPTLEVLGDIIGKVIVHETKHGRTAGVIVEAEAYIGEDDPACHASAGPTRRNAPLYGPPGFAYVYLNYGLHYLVNAVTEEAGTPAAVLLRALEPLEGLPLMRARRGKRAATAVGHLADAALCRGPGNLSVAMGIDLAQNQVDLTGRTLWIEDRGIDPGPRVYSPRIGIRVGTDRPWRCSVAGHDGVSGRKRITN
jgi:DNA-3-methyladenine glycosylase